ILLPAGRPGAAQRGTARRRYRTAARHGAAPIQRCGIFRNHLANPAGGKRHAPDLENPHEAEILAAAHHRAGHCGKRTARACALHRERHRKAGERMGHRPQQKQTVTCPRVLQCISKSLWRRLAWRKDQPGRAVFEEQAWELTTLPAALWPGMPNTAATISPGSAARAHIASGCRKSCCSKPRLPPLFRITKNSCSASPMCWHWRKAGRTKCCITGPALVTTPGHATCIAPRKSSAMNTAAGSPRNLLRWLPCPASAVPPPAPFSLWRKIGRAACRE